LLRGDGVNLSTIYRVFDTVVSVLDTKKDDVREQAPSDVSHTPMPSFADQLEARLTNVVVAALKEAFDRDHARLELERAHFDEQRRQAEESMRRELQRQAIDREISRLRLVAGAGLVGWIASVVLLVTRSQQISGSSRAALIAACVLLLGSVGSAFTAQANIGARIRESDGALKTAAGTASLWLLLAGLALAAGSLF
jgi:hypothetical protein